jgi:hypothetical protein
VTQYVRGFEENLQHAVGYYRLIEGLGSRSGLLYQNIISYPPELRLISICKNDSLSYLDSSFYNHIPGDYCDEEHIKSLLVSVKKRPQKQINIFPNPASTTLYLSENYVGRFKISNSVGQTILSGDISDRIDISSLSPKIYFIQLFTEDFIGVAKFIKE